MTPRKKVGRISWPMFATLHKIQCWMMSYEQAAAKVLRSLGLPARKGK
jgi:hypothetical protein